MNSKVELAERFANLWRTSREDAHKSQDFMAKHLGVSKKTIQNWESGLSCPSQLMGFLWFQAIGRQPLPYYLRVLYPDNFDKPADDMTDAEIDKALSVLIRDFPTDAKLKLLYLLSGDHGSSPVAMLEMITAHLQTPLRDRLNIAQCVATNYEMAQSSGKLQQPDEIQPNIEMFLKGLELGTAAVKAGRNAYSVAEEGEP